jgi:hypothetical protein
MSTNNFFRSDLPKLYNFIQSSMIVYPKEIIIAVLRNYFSKDSFYHYSKDQWGYPNTVDHTDLPINAGLNDDITTRLFIGENYRQDGIFYPAILVKNSGSKSVPISINRDKGSIQYSEVLYEDQYGHQSLVKTPSSLITAGAWEGSITIDILTRSLRSRDDLVELVAMCFTEIEFETIADVGVIIKPISIGAPSETDDRNDKLFRQSLTLDIRTEWRREIPVGNLIDAIFFTIYFQELSNPNKPPAPNLTINTEVSIFDAILDN